MKKQTTLSKAVRIMLIAGIGSIAFAGPYSGGQGTPDDPYQIATARDLVDLGETLDDYDKHFVLVADIDLLGRVFDRAVIAWNTETRLHSRAILSMYSRRLSYGQSPCADGEWVWGHSVL